MATKKHGAESKDKDGKRVISDALRKALKDERKRLGATDDWEPEQAYIGEAK